MTKVRARPGVQGQASLIQRPQAQATARTQNTWEVTCVKPNGEVRWKEIVRNHCTDEGLTHMLEVTLGAGTQDTTWFVGLIDSVSYTTTAIDDQGADIRAQTGTPVNLWLENINQYTGDRPAWSPDAAAAKSISNSTPTAFTMTGTATIKGAFLNGVTTKSTPTVGGGVLYCTAVFTGGDRAVQNNDTLNVTVTCTLADV